MVAADTLLYCIATRLSFCSCSAALCSAICDCGYSCYTPLMRSRDHEVRCIACNLPVVIEQQVQQPAQLQSASSNTAVGVGPEQVPAATAGPASVNVGQEIGAQATSSQQKEERASDMQGTLNEGQVPNASCTSVDEGQVRKKSQSAVSEGASITTCNLLHHWL